MKRKFVSLLALIMCLCLCLTACGNKTDSSPSNSQPSAPSDSSNAPSTAPSAPAEPSGGDENADDPYAEARAFYAGTDLEIIVPLGAGGGMDVAARNAAPFLQELLGTKSVTVTNMTGASGIVAYNWLYTEAERDGSIICFGSNPASNAVVQNDSACVYKSDEFVFLGTVQHTGYALTVHPDNPNADLDTFLANDKFLIGGFAYNDTMSLYGAITCEIMGKPNGAVIGGYGTAANELLAMAQGEIDAYTCPLDSMYRYVEGGQCVPIMLYASERDPYWPDVPTVYELFDITEEQEQILKTVPESDRIIFAPPGIPDDRAAFLEYCVTQMLEDPAFKEQTMNSTGYFSGVRNGQETYEAVMNTINNFDSYRILDDLIAKYAK